MDEIGWSITLSCVAILLSVLALLWDYRVSKRQTYYDRIEKLLNPIILQKRDLLLNGRIDMESYRRIFENRYLAGPIKPELDRFCKAYQSYIDGIAKARGIDSTASGRVRAFIERLREADALKKAKIPEEGKDELAEAAEKLVDAAMKEYDRLERRIWRRFV